MSPWRCQLKLLGKKLRQIKKWHSTDLHGGVKGKFSGGLFSGPALTVPAIVFAGQGVKSAYRIFSCPVLQSFLLQGPPPPKVKPTAKPFSPTTMAAGAGLQFCKY